MKAPDQVAAPPKAAAAEIFGNARHLAAAAGAAIGLYSAALLWGAHQDRTGMFALACGVAAGLALEYEPSMLVRAAGYLLGLLSVSLAIPAGGLAALAYGPWIILGAALFPGWPAAIGLGAAGVASYLLAVVPVSSPTSVPLIAVAAAIALLALAAALVAGEARSRSVLALTDPLTGLANRRLLGWRLAEELSQAKRTGSTFALVHLDIQDFKQVNLHQILQDATRGHDVVARITGDQFAILAPGLGETDASVVVERIRTAIGRAATLPAPVHLTAGWAIAPRDGTDADALLETAESSVFEQKLARRAGPTLPMELTEALWSLPDGVQDLIRLLHTESIEHEGHLSRVGQWSLDLGRLAGLDQERQQALAQAALVHDIGKFALPRSLLRKPGALSPEEQAQMVRHVPSGVALLRALGVSETVIAIVAAHHERWDGTGYPAGLAGDRIPLEARILSIADGCDAMTARRPHRKPWTTDEAVADLRLEGGRQFDPELVDLIIPVLSATG
ncbi:MAG: diguanylate cyclase [Bacillati bacterium ANGP1]|uniref:Diguanylate cyclase n=1 Tax=Candidatus Segetimicrobium genomatis TaxID=2569760 RepID=A0A537JC10_9BACT|nr:MAG: diguanylate cyclase [Terrabacteria group bacterium ANGP1]